MDICRDFKNFKLMNTAVAMGLFDGMHLGHIKILETLNNFKGNYTKCVFTFLIDDLKPNSKKNADKIISEKEKDNIFELSGIEYLLKPNFKDIMFYSSIDFVKEVLINKLDIKLIICGKDFRFGYNRHGDINLLKEMFSKLNRKICVVDDVLTEGKKISSTIIRNYIIKGEIEKANILLGRNFLLDFDIFCDKDNRILIQKIENGYVQPLEGEYISHILCDKHPIIETKTLIVKKNHTFAITYCDIRLHNIRLDEIKIELLKRI